MQRFVRGCGACQLHKRPRHPERAKLQVADIPSIVLERVQIDFVGPFPPSVPSGYCYVLAIQDVLSRFSLLIPTHDCGAGSAARIFRENWVCVFGVPKVLQSDRGSHFMSSVFKLVCRHLGFGMLWPVQTILDCGQVERQN